MTSMILIGGSVYTAGNGTSMPVHLSSTGGVNWLGAQDFRELFESLDRDGSGKLSLGRAQCFRFRDLCVQFAYFLVSIDSIPRVRFAIKIDSTTAKVHIQRTTQPKFCHLHGLCN